MKKVHKCKECEKEYNSLIGELKILLRSYKPRILSSESFNITYGIELKGGHKVNLNIYLD